MKHFLTKKSPLLKAICIILITIAATGSKSVIHAEEAYVIICNHTNSISSISGTDVMNIFLGKKVSWNDGKKVTFVTLKEGESNKQFLRDHVKKNPQQFKNYWKKMLFTGKGVVPKSFDDDTGVIDFVSQNEGAIGYISRTTDAAGVKALPISN